MSGKSGFWGWHAYAKANDEIRNKLIEESWFGRESQDNSMQRDVAAMEDSQDPGIHGQGVDDPYGNAPQQSDMSSFYGHDTEQDGAGDIYGHDQDIDQEPEPEQ